MSKPIDQIFSESRTMLNNILDDAEILAVLEVFGYDEEKLRAGLSLYDAARALHTKQIDEYGDKAAASAAMTEARNQLNKTYSAHVKIARVALKNDAGAFGDLKLNGPRRRNHDAWLQQTHDFYAQVLAQKAYQTELAKFGVTETKLTEGKNLVIAAERAYNSYKKEAGEAQRATKARDESVDVLEDFMSDLTAIVRVAFEGHAQTLEILGIVVKS